MNEATGAGKPLESAGEWECRPCRDGLLLRRTPTDSEAPKAGERVGPGTSRRLLPAGAILEDEVSNEPPLVIRLGDAEVESLTSTGKDGVDVAAATHFGPPQQDKLWNEDFALAGVVTAADGAWGVAAVADGVSTKTFWAARTARIACLTAFQHTHAWVRQGHAPENDDALRRFVRELAQGLRVALRADRDHIKQHNAHPGNWRRELFEQYAERDALWYNSTLLLTAIGPTNGFVVWIGDGAIRLSQAGSPPRDILCSTDDLSIPASVSLNVDARAIRSEHLRFDGTQHVEIVLASDGVARSLEGRSYEALSLDSAKAAQAALDRLTREPGCELDNYSVAWVSRSAAAPRQVASDVAPAGRDPKSTEEPEGAVTALTEPRSARGAGMSPRAERPGPPRGGGVVRGLRRGAVSRVALALAPVLGGFALGLITAWVGAWVLHHGRSRNVAAADEPTPAKPHTGLCLRRWLNNEEIQALDRGEVPETLRATLDAWRARVPSAKERELALLVRSSRQVVARDTRLKWAELLRAELTDPDTAGDFVIAIGPPCADAHATSSHEVQIALVENVWDRRACEEGS